MPTKIIFMHVVAEMVASVHSFEAEIGDQVSAGDTLLILESMKMEIPVLAEHSGVVSEFAVAIGDVVNEGDLLVILK
jgi:acetyl-CoA carboxylase biotin carboxyl carrier protein